MSRVSMNVKKRNRLNAFLVYKIREYTIYDDGNSRCDAVVGFLIQCALVSIIVLIQCALVSIIVLEDCPAFHQSLQTNFEVRF